MDFSDVLTNSQSMRGEMAAQFLTMVACLALVGCSAQNSPGTNELLSHTWAPTAEACGTDFLRFTPTALEVHNVRGVSALQVFKYTTVDSYPNAVMVVVGPHEPGSSEAVAESDKIGFVLDLSNDRMRLVGGGSPTHLQPATAENPNVQRFERIRCA